MNHYAALLLALLAIFSLPACQTEKPVEQPKRARAGARLTLTLIEALPPHETADFPVAGGVAPERGKMAMVTETELDEALKVVSAWGGSEPLTLPPLEAVHGDMGRSEMMSPAVYGPPGEAPPKEGVRWKALPQINEKTGAISVRCDLRLTESLGLVDPHTPRQAGVRPEYRAHVIEANISLDFTPGEAAVFCVGTSSEGHPVWGVMRAKFLPAGSVDSRTSITLKKREE